MIIESLPDIEFSRCIAKIYVRSLSYKNERVRVGMPDEYFKNVFESELCKQTFCSCFKEELYKIAGRNLREASYHPLSECFTVIAVAKCLMDVQVSEMMGRKQAYDDMKYFLKDNQTSDSGSKNSCLREFKKQLECYDRIVIYGAGLYGGLLLEKIYDWHIYKEVEFVTSDALGVKQHLGHKLYNVSKLHAEQDNYIVVVAAGERLESEMINTLKHFNISSYIRLSDEMRSALK